MLSLIKLIIILFLVFVIISLIANLLFKIGVVVLIGAIIYYILKKSGENS